MRFYDRQFTERHELNRDVLQRFENLLNEYFISGDAERLGLPTVNYFADKISLSPNYFGDLVKRETGVSAKEYLRKKLLEAAKEQLLNPQKSISQGRPIARFPISAAFRPVLQKHDRHDTGRVSGEAA